MRMPLGKTLLLLVALSLAGPAAAAPPRDTREMQAREAFAAGRYQESLDLFVKLYAEQLHPNYLRNIGRCYQNLGDPDKAISSFREYLRKAKGVSADERAEIDGYIKEMEELKRKQAAPPPVEAKPEPVTPRLPPPEIHEPTATAMTTPLPPAPEASPPVYKRWWFWTAIGVAVAAGVVVAVTAGGAKDPGCDPGRACPK
jgi:hypothetical protein